MPKIPPHVVPSPPHIIPTPPQIAPIPAYQHIWFPSLPQYIQAATRTRQIWNAFAGRVTPKFLKEAKLLDQLPLIIVCDRFDNSMFK
jgi:hypothetical protein